VPLRSYTAGMGTDELPGTDLTLVSRRANGRCEPGRLSDSAEGTGLARFGELPQERSSNPDDFAQFERDGECFTEPQTSDRSS